MIKYIGLKYPGMLEDESKSDPCLRCKNGPVPNDICSSCGNYERACKLHGTSWTLETEEDLKNTNGIDIESVMLTASWKYTIAQIEAINDHVAFFNKVLKGWLDNNIPIDEPRKAFLDSIIKNIVNTARYNSCAASHKEFTEHN